MKYIYLLFFLILMGSVKGQSLTGTKGLLHVPTAELYPDKTFAIGASFLPLPYMSYSRGGEQYDAYATYVTATFFPWMEVMFRRTLPRQNLCYWSIFSTPTLYELLQRWGTIRRLCDLCNCYFFSMDGSNVSLYPPNW